MTLRPRYQWSAVGITTKGFYDHIWKARNACLISCFQDAQALHAYKFRDYEGRLGNSSYIRERVLALLQTIAHRCPGSLASAGGLFVVSTGIACQLPSGSFYKMEDCTACNFSRQEARILAAISPLRSGICLNFVLCQFLSGNRRHYKSGLYVYRIHGEAVWVKIIR